MLFVYYKSLNHLTNSLRSCPEENTPPFADRMITRRLLSTLWSRFDLSVSSMARERAFLKNSNEFPSCKLLTFLS